MLQKKEFPKAKPGLHPRNKHRGRYDFKALITHFPGLSAFVRPNEYTDESIDFANAEAVMALNKALLKHDYAINQWSIPAGYLCPPIPGRADYIHYAADLLGSADNGKIPSGNTIHCLDVGIGANCIYPIIGNTEYGWSFVGSDIDPGAIQSAAKIVASNASLKGHIELRLQPNARDIFQGIIRSDDRFDLTICNPPFHSSLQEAQAGTLRKLSNLNRKRVTRPTLNFGGKNNELWCEGGEEQFVKKLIHQSKPYATSCFWFTTLVAKSAHLKSIYSALKNTAAVEVRTIAMHQGNKISRIVAWTYLTPGQQKNWMATRWK